MSIRQPQIVFSMPIEDFIEAVAVRVEQLIEDRAVAVQSKPKEVMVTRKAAAAYLTISGTTLSKLTREGKVPAYRIANRVLYKQSELETAMKKVNNLKTTK